MNNRQEFEWEVQGNYGYGWEAVFTATSPSEANQILREYQEHENGIPFRVKKARADELPTKLQ